MVFMQLMWNSWSPLVIIPFKCRKASPHRGLAILSHMDRDCELQKRITIALSGLLKFRSRRMTAHKWCWIMCLQTHPHFLISITTSFHIRFFDYHFSNNYNRSGRTVSLCGQNVLRYNYMVVFFFRNINLVCFEDGAIQQIMFCTPKYIFINFQADLEFFKCGTSPIIFYGVCPILQEDMPHPLPPFSNSVKDKTWYNGNVIKAGNL
jgi:hypothetical protein